MCPKRSRHVRDRLAEKGGIRAQPRLRDTLALVPAFDPRLRYVRCAIYTRQSVARPGRDPALASCRLQREACFRFIASHIDQRWVPVAESFDDEGESGASIERPAFMRLLQRVDQGLVDQVVVHRLDRLTRNTRDWARIQMHLEPRNVGVAVVTGSVQTGTTALAGFQLNMLAAIAECTARGLRPCSWTSLYSVQQTGLRTVRFEREMIADRLRDARTARKQRDLRSAGRIPYGYASDPRTRQLFVVASEAEIVRMAFRLAAADLNPSQIAQSLSAGPHAEPEKPRRWHPRTVLRMLRNRTYLGLMPDGSPAVHDAIIADELFAKVADVLDGRRTRTPSPRPQQEGADPFLLRGLLVCGQCGRPMTTTSPRKVKSVPVTGHRRLPLHRYYRCRGPKPCPGAHVPAEFIEERLLEVMADPPAGLAPVARHTFMCIARDWPLLVHMNRRLFLVAYLEKVIWHPTWNLPQPVLAADLTLKFDMAQRFWPSQPPAG